MSKFELRDYRATDREAVRRALAFLPKLYPGGDAWLERRLDDVEALTAMCKVVLVQSTIAGMTIQTPKGGAVCKLSTIFVAEEFRGNGVGPRLLADALGTSRCLGLDHIYVTVASHKSTELAPLLIEHGFRLARVDYQRYGPDRDELVFNRPPRPR